MKLIKNKKEYYLPNEWVITNFLKSHYYKDYINGESLEKCVGLSIVSTEGLVSICEQDEFDELLNELKKEVNKG